MDVPGKHDMGGAQARRRRDDALANPGRIDADDRGVLKNPRPRPSRQRRQALDVFAAVDLKRIGIIDTVKVTIGLELGAHAVNLPSLHISLKDRSRSEEHTSELQSQSNLVCRLLLEKKKKNTVQLTTAYIHILIQLTASSVVLYQPNCSAQSFTAILVSLLVLSSHYVSNSLLLLLLL